jgi:hypothetical protein
MTLDKIIIGDNEIIIPDLNSGKEFYDNTRKYFEMVWYANTESKTFRIEWFSFKPLELEKRFEKVIFVDSDNNRVDIIELTYLLNLIYPREDFVEIESNYHVVDSLNYENVQVETMIDEDTYERVICIVNRTSLNKWG